MTYQPVRSMTAVPPLDCLYVAVPYGRQPCNLPQKCSVKLALTQSWLIQTSIVTVMLINFIIDSGANLRFAGLE